jgi:hypothetical protein
MIMTKLFSTVAALGLVAAIATPALADIDAKKFFDQRDREHYNVDAGKLFRDLDKDHYNTDIQTIWTDLDKQRY